MSEPLTASHSIDLQSIYLKEKAVQPFHSFYWKKTTNLKYGNRKSKKSKKSRKIAKNVNLTKYFYNRYNITKVF